MIQLIRNLLGLKAPVDFGTLVQNGAQIIDVRTKDEFQGGHIKGAVNIPLQSLSGQLAKIRKDKPVITCCASGMRSGAAKSLLTSHGYKQVYNGGGWSSLQRKLNH